MILHSQLEAGVSPLIRACRCCHSASLVTKYHFNYGTIQECTECGSACVEYIKGDIPDFNAEFSSAAWLRSRRYEYPFLMKQATARLHLLERYISGTTLLEVGSGEGVFLEAASSKGWNAVGLDRYCKPQAFGRSRRAPAVIGDAQMPPFKQVFDAVVGFHVLEHVESVDAFLDGLFSVMAEKGFVCFEVPNYGSMQRHLGQSRWSNFYPYHKTHFSRKGLIRLLERKGMKVYWCGSVGDSWEIMGKYYHHVRNLVWGPLKRVLSFRARERAEAYAGAVQPTFKPTGGKLGLYALEGRIMRLLAVSLFGLPIWVLNLVGQGPNLAVIAQRLPIISDHK